MRQAVGLVSVVLAIGLAVLIGTRMSADALGMLLGVVVGVLASLPTSLVLIWALVRRTQRADSVEVRERGGMGGASYPPVVVVNPGPGYGLGYGPPPGVAGSLPPPGGPRSFKVVGDEETLLDQVGHIFSGLTEEVEDRRH